MRFQQIVRIFSTTVGQACAGAKPGIEAEIFYDFGPEELQIGLPVFERPDLTHGSILAARRRNWGCVNTFTHYSSGLRMTLKGLYYLS